VLEQILGATARVDTRWALLAYLIVLDVWSIGLILRSGASRREKALWTGVVVLCPVVGCVYWYVLGPKPDYGPGS